MKKSLFLGSAAGVLLLTQHIFAATLTAVPMQGGMVMPMLMYHADHNHLHVMMTTEIPALTPLLVSNPADRFDALDPWFAALDPGAQGASFSRRYGFMWDGAMSDELPANTEVWLRKTASSPGLDIYRYNGSAPKAFEPIFGTAGTTNAIAWDLLMFHPCFTAAPGTNAHSATFEAFLVDNSTGQALPGTGTGAFTLNFTNLNDGRPTLKLMPKVAVGWPGGTATNWVLEAASSVSATNWTRVTNAPVSLDGQTSAVLDADVAQQFFRLRYVP